MRRSTRLATVPRAMKLLVSATSLVVLMWTPVFAQNNQNNQDQNQNGQGQNQNGPHPITVPEMSSTVLLASALVGLGGLGLWSRRKWRGSR